MPRWLRDRGGRPLTSGDSMVMVNGGMSSPTMYDVARGRDGGRVSHTDVFRAMQELNHYIPYEGPQYIFEYYIPIESRRRRNTYYGPDLLPRSMVLRPDMQATIIQRAWRGHRDRRRAGLSAALGSMHRGETEGRLPHLPADVRSSILRSSALVLPEDKQKDEPIGLAAAGYQRRARRQKVTAKRVRKAPAKKRPRRARR